MKSASGLAAAMTRLSTMKPAKARRRSASSFSKPMLVHTSVVTRSAPSAARTGSASASIPLASRRRSGLTA